MINKKVKKNRKINRKKLITNCMKKYENNYILNLNKIKLLISIFKKEKHKLLIQLH